MLHLYDSPLYTLQERLEIAKGEINFCEDVIKNLNSQIAALRLALHNCGMSEDVILMTQLAHLKETK